MRISSAYILFFFEFNLDICVNALSEKGSSRVLRNT